ncbi:MAG: hypothetical protein R2690_08205 [Acidimicrobiales bacterium]
MVVDVIDGLNDRAGLAVTRSEVQPATDETADVLDEGRVVDVGPGGACAASEERHVVLEGRIGRGEHPGEHAPLGAAGVAGNGHVLQRQLVSRNGP